jgi:hypothetical protein
MTRGNHSDLISDKGPWYSPGGRDNLSPGLLEQTTPLPRAGPAPRQRSPGRHRKQGKPHKSKRAPARKINSRYIFAATLTAFLAVPALWMADYIATHNGNESQTVQLVNKNAYMPMTLYAKGTRTPICVYVTESGDNWKAWATDKAC